MTMLKLRRYVCTGCRARWREEETNHEGDIYNLECPVCDIERPMTARAWSPTSDPKILNAAGRSGIIPV